MCRMAPSQSKITLTPPPSNQFFVPASQRPRRDRPVRNYNHMENGGGIDISPASSSPSPSMSSTTTIESSITPDDTIVVDDVPPGHDDYPSDDEMEDLPVPAFEDTIMMNME